MLIYPVQGACRVKHTLEGFAQSAPPVDENDRHFGIIGLVGLRGACCREILSPKLVQCFRVILVHRFPELDVGKSEKVQEHADVRKRQISHGESDEAVMPFVIAASRANFNHLLAKRFHHNPQEVFMLVKF